jgi:hypothetical protein
MKIIAFKVNGCYILKNYAAGRRDRFDVFKPNPTGSTMLRIGCELPLGHAKSIAVGGGKA